MDTNIYKIPVQGSRIQRAIITALNFMTGIVYKNNIKPNNERLDKNIAEVSNLKQESLDNYESLLDTQFELEQAKDDIVDQMESQIDLEFRVAQLEDREE